MERPYYSEEQRFDQPWFRVIILATWVPLVTIFGIGIYRQLVLGKPWGNHPASDTGLVVVTGSIFLLMTGLTWLLFSLRLIVEISGKGLQFRFPPMIRKPRLISPGEIGEYRIREYSPVREYGGWGIRTGGFKNGVAYNVKGNTGLQLELKSGKRILFGTQRPDALKSAMDRMMNPQLT
ncbi:MAG: hypothetical protein WCO44_16735 [Bacteroidota bacterium]